MPFNSPQFLLFFPAAYALYLAARKSLRLQNVILLAASYVFYGFWSVKFLALIALSTAFTFTVGRWIASLEEDSPRRRWAMWIGVAGNLAVLGVFKYAGFFAENFADLLQLAGFAVSDVTLRLILPLGISFYTFKAVGYLIDIENGVIEPERDYVNFSVFIAFFPTLTAGPIDRPETFLPQLSKPRQITASHIDEGLFLIVWGYLQKVAVADNLQSTVQRVFENPTANGGLDMVVGIVAFAFQMYWDFSGYSDIARGLARLMGFDVILNFNLPFFAKNPNDYWSRWHISLSTWFHDYLYMPFAMWGQRIHPMVGTFALWFTMVLIGFWHGADWNYIVFGAFHGFLVIGHRELTRRLGKKGKDMSGLFSFSRWWKIALMFTCAAVALSIFRSESLADAWYVLTHVGISQGPLSRVWAYELIFFILPVAAMDLYRYAKQDLLAPLRLPTWGKALLYAAAICWILVFGRRRSIEFIYFKF